MAYLTPHLQIMADAARLAAKLQRKFFYQTFDMGIEKKGPADFVTQCDKKSEEIIINELLSKRPTYSFLSEESDPIKGKDNSNRFIIDPIDGTTNFIRKLPLFAISIGLERDRVPFAGVIYNPITDDLFYAEKGFGAFHNNNRIRVAKTTNLSLALLGTGLPFLGHEHPILDDISKVAPKTMGIRRFGSAALDLAFVANGNLDGFWEYYLLPWDITAGIIIVQEAGGMVNITPRNNNKKEIRCHLNGSIIATNGLIHDQLTALIS